MKNGQKNTNRSNMGRPKVNRYETVNGVNKKICSKCKKSLDPDKFSKNVRSIDGLKHRCRLCIKKYSYIKRKEYREHYTNVFMTSDPTVRFNDRGGYVKLSFSGFMIDEHRHVVNKSLGRVLESWEHVHHVDGDRSNNKLSNLHLVTRSDHVCMTAINNEIKIMISFIKIILWIH